MKYTALIQGERVEVELNRDASNRIEARVGNRTYVLDAAAVEPDTYSFICDDKSVEIRVTQNRNGYVVSWANRQIAVETLDARSARRRAAQQTHDGVVELRAPMPGKIVKVLLSEGSTVEVNQGVAVMEAMKMQNEIRSPKKGVLRQLGVSEGAAVNAGDLIGRVE